MNDIENNDLEKVTQNILELKQRTTDDFIALGAELNKAKAIVPYGQWESYLDQRIGFSRRTARTFMRIADVFSGKGKALSVLGKSKLSLLAFADEPVRERLLSDGRLEEMSVRELKSNISAMENESHDVRYRSFRKVFRPEGMGDDALMPVDELKPLPSHEEYYKPRKGKAWLSFLGSVQKHGIIVPVTITDDHYILDGHDRVRACKDLGIEDITVFYATAADEAITHWVEEGLSVDTVKKVYYLTSNAGTPHYPDGSRDFTPEYFARMECCQLFGDEARAKHNADLFVKEAIKWGHIRQDTFLGEAEG